MLFPLAAVFKRGAVFRQGLYDKLHDPKYAGGQTKPKYFVVLSASPKDDPIVYLLTTSKQKSGKYFFVIAGARYDFFPVQTLIDVTTAGALDIPRDQFAKLYQTGQIELLGHLSDADVDALLDLIMECPVVEENFKRTLKDPGP